MSAFSKLRAPYKDCRTLPFTNTTGSTLLGGTWHTVGAKHGIVLGDVADTKDGLLLVEVPEPGILVPKNTSVAFSTGGKLYFDAADGEVNDDSAGNPEIGYAYRAAQTADAEVLAVLTNL